MTGAWAKSSFSGSHNASCVELRWRRSSAPCGPSHNCVEAAYASTDEVQLRDSKNARGPRLRLPAEALSELLAYARVG